MRRKALFLGLLLVSGCLISGQDLYDDFVIDSGCGGCAVGFVGTELEARIEGGTDDHDTAYGLRDFGGGNGWAGRIWTRDVIRLAPGQSLSANLAVFQLRDADDALVFEIYLGPDRTVRLWSPRGGLAGTSINASTDVAVPDDGVSTTAVEVSALRNASVVVRVDGTDRIVLGSLDGATTRNPRRLRAGIDHYDSAVSEEQVAIYHSKVNASTSGWLGPPLFARNLVDAQGGGQQVDALGVGDIDGDGRPDVAVGGNNRLLWYRNPDWAASTIAVGGYGAGAMTLVRDIDGDGRRDVVTGEDASGSTVWFGNTPAGWARHVLTAGAYCHDLAVGDLNADGRADLACVDQYYHGEIFWLEAPADPTAPWPVHVIDPDRNAMGAAIADIDGDGRPDVVAGRAWYQNVDGSPWPRHPYTTMTDPARAGFDDYAKVTVLDLDGHRPPDLFVTLFSETPEGEVFAFLAPSDPATGSWTPVLIDPGPLFGVHSQAAAPFDGTPRHQVMVGETNIGGFDFGTNPDPQIYVYRLLGPPGRVASWERSLVDQLGTHEAQAVDLDGDGLPDIVGHDENTPGNGAVRWWRNVTPR